MAENNDDRKGGILRGLKKILFTSGPDEAPAPEPAPESKPAPAILSNDKPVFSPEPTGEDKSENLKEMKLRIYQVLESLNKPGCDFFEVWNASVEMGGANSNNIKAAYTSLKYADKTLTKDKLLDTGAYYISSLSKILDSETVKRQQEKDKLLSQKEEEKTSLTTEINELEQQLLAIQKKLADKKAQREGINQKYQPQVESIGQKITAGNQSVNSVINEMQAVVSIIQKEIN